LIHAARRSARFPVIERKTAKERFSRSDLRIFGFAIPLQAPPGCRTMSSLSYGSSKGVVEP
jgi:hypothetical protein